MFASAAFGQAQFIGGVWSGNVTPTSATVVVRLDQAAVRVRLQVSEKESLSPAIFSAIATTDASSGNTVKLTVQGLLPNTDYYYGIEVTGALRSDAVSRGRFHTFPLGRASFRVAFSSSSDFRQADQSAYDAIIAERPLPLLFICTGDLHAIDTNSIDRDPYRKNYDGVLSHASEGPLFRAMPMAYMWNAHDYCGEGTDGSATGRATATAVYRERVPHYPLAAAGSTLAQAFTIGRVRFILTDLRSAASAATLKESASKSRMGAAQKTWFKQELINARDSGFPAIVWVCPDPWIMPARVGDDSWAGYATERTDIANFIRDNHVTNVILLSGDMHALAFDDGSHADYAVGGGGEVTVLQAGSLTGDGSSMGGPYIDGPFTGGQQYGVLEVYDNGGPSVACRFLGIKARQGRRVTRFFSSSAANVTRHALVNISTLAKLTSATDSLTSGFVVSADPQTTVLVRAIGPTLTEFGISDALPQPSLSVFHGKDLVATSPQVTPATTETNTDDLLDASDKVGAFRLNNGTTGSRDAAMLLNLAPGAYTVTVKSADGKPGTTLLEVYDVPP